MKHSRVIVLTLSCCFAATALVSCADPEPPKIYSTVIACTKEQRSKEDCTNLYNAAFKEYLEYAPRYGSEAACKKEGSETCLEVGLHPDSIWLPKMVGFTNSGNSLYLAAAGTSNPKDRVVARPTGNDDGSFIILGNYYSYSGGRPYGLIEGMYAARTSGTVTRTNALGAKTGSYSSSVRSGPRTGSVSRGGFGSRGFSGGS